MQFYTESDTESTNFSKIVVITKDGGIYYTDDYNKFTPLEVRDIIEDIFVPKFKYLKGQTLYDENNNLYHPNPENFRLSQESSSQDRRNFTYINDYFAIYDNDVYAIENKNFTKVDTGDPVIYTIFIKVDIGTPVKYAISLDQINEQVFLSNDGKLYLKSYNRIIPINWDKEIRIIPVMFASFVSAFFAQDVDGYLLLINIRNLEITNLGQYEPFEKIYQLQHINWGTGDLDGDRTNIPLLITKTGDLLVLIEGTFYLIDNNVKTLFYASQYDITQKYRINESVIESLPKWTYIYLKHQ